MNVLAFVITTVALLALVIFFTWYTNYYMAVNMLSTVNYVSSLVSSALTHEFENAIAIASMGDVVGSFNYTLLLPTSAVPVQGVALNYKITLYPKNQSLYANITVTMSMGPLSRSENTTVLVYSSAQPYEITAYNCEKSNSPVTLVNPAWASQGLPNPVPNCTWTSAQVQLGEAVIGISKG
ncbi:MAG: hypothetical protein ACP5L5_09645 [Vulcanisaeta sp.]|uniref:hypothetical protein n=1 Tax=Vulcanisaeta sp. TaxID=2020871 RepID=UPI003D11E098